MKIVKAIIFALYVLIYIYGAYKTIVEPEEIIWGYICTGVFAFIFIWGVQLVIESDRKHNKPQENP